jgi:hypothetical protein
MPIAIAMSERMSERIRETTVREMSAVDTVAAVRESHRRMRMKMRMNEERGAQPAVANAEPKHKQPAGAFRTGM